MEKINLLENIKLIDLTHALHEGIPTWDGSCGFEHHIRDDYALSASFQIRTHNLRLQEGIGTHMDAPAHFFPQGKTIESLDLNHLISPCYVIKIDQKATERYALSVKDIQEFESIHGKIQPGCFVVVYTGWDQYWGTPEKYRNNHLFPSVSEEAAEVLLARKIVGLGIDTLSPDRPEDGFPVHQMVLGAGKYIIENIANAAKLPPQGAYTLALPMKIKKGTEAPLRLIGLLPS